MNIKFLSMSRFAIYIFRDLRSLFRVSVWVRQNERKGMNRTYRNEESNESKTEQIEDEDQQQQEEAVESVRWRDRPACPLPFRAAGERVESRRVRRVCRGTCSASFVVARLCGEVCGWVGRDLCVSGSLLAGGNLAVHQRRLRRRTVRWLINMVSTAMRARNEWSVLWER